jgi:molybdopterin adenylyltransferase
MVKIGIVTISDRASAGIYEDLSGQELKRFLEEQITNRFEVVYRLIPDEKEQIVKTLRELVGEGCSLILTTGGTGPAPRDVTPEATREVVEKELPGFGEAMRSYSLQFVPTAILARGIAGVVGSTLIVNLPGSPKGARENLEAVWAAIPYCLDLIGGGYIESPTAFRPKKK